MQKTCLVKWVCGQTSPVIESAADSESDSYLLCKVLTVPDEAVDLKLIKKVKVIIYLACLSVYSASDAH